MDNSTRNKDYLTCKNCDHSFHDVKELAVHQLDHLVIHLSFLTICPICDEELSELEECCDHVLRHFSTNKLEKSKILKMLSEMNENTNKMNSPKKKLFQSYTDHGVYASNNLTICLPKIMPHWKCIFCDKFYKPEAIEEHVFNHLNVSRNQREKVLIWFSKFFESNNGQAIKDKNADYLNAVRTLDLNSTLLKELSRYENSNTNTCRYCNINASNSSQLYAHYVEWHNMPSKDYWNCLACNFKVPESDMLLDHILKNHIGCVFCHTKFPDFASCLLHIEVSCRKRHCIYCRNKMSNFETLIKHMNKGIKAIVCPYCKKHLGGYRELKAHVKDCSKREPVGVSCPFCKHQQFTLQADFNAHVLNCRPWLNNHDNKPLKCSNGITNSTVNSPKTDIIDYNSIKNLLEYKSKSKIEKLYV